MSDTERKIRCSGKAEKHIKRKCIEITSFNHLDAASFSPFFMALAWKEKIFNSQKRIIN